MSYDMEPLFMSRYDRDISYYLIKDRYAEVIRWRTLYGLENPDSKVVVTNGCFDILHLGHVAMLENAKHFGDILIVLVNSDVSIKKLKGEGRPVNNFEYRKKMLLSLKSVDYVFEFDDTNCSRLLTCVHPHIYFKASDYSLKTMNKEEKNALKRMGTKISFGPFLPNLSTTNIIDKCKRLQ